MAPRARSGILETRWVLLIILFVVILGTVATFLIKASTEMRQKESLLIYAEITSTAIDPLDVASLQGSESDLESPSYQKIKVQLEKIRAGHPDIRFVYLMGHHEEDGPLLFFFVDSEDPSSDGYSAPGDLYPETNDVELDNFNNGTPFVEGPTSDSFGTWVSGFAPIKDENGRTISMAGIDIAAKTWNITIFQAMLIPILATLFIVVLLLLYLLYQRRIRRYLEQIEASEKDAEVQKDRLRQLYEIGARRSLDVGDQFRAALKTGNDALNTKMAFITRITDDSIFVKYAVVPPDTIKDGEKFSLKETYCDIAITANDIVAISSIDESEYRSHGCHSKLCREAYIGVPIKVNGELYGTLDFLAPEKRRPGFTESDKDFVRLMASWISATLERSEIDKMKSEFVSLASHQLNTPLSTINWYTDLLLTDKEVELSKDQREYISEIGGATTRMVDLVNALLNVSRIEMGTFGVTPVPTHLEELAKSLIKELNHQIDERRIELISQFDPDLPKIPADPSLLRIVFQNLLTNAIKYNIDHGKIYLKIIRRPEYKNMVYVEVKDTGLGVPNKDKPRIFDKMFRADNAKKKITDGNGLGLYIVKSIIESSGGRIWFESEENVGTTFSFTMPLTGMKAKAGSKPLQEGQKHKL